MSTWWRRNRLWLALLPVVLLVLAAASSSRYFEIWRHLDFTERVAEGPAGKPLQVDLTSGSQDRSFTIELTGIEQRDTVPAEYGEPEPVPEGQQGWTVSLAFSDAVQEGVEDCNLMLVDRRGDRYGSEGVDPWGDHTPCGPSDEDVDDEARAWTAEAFLVTPEGADLRELWLTYDLDEEHYAVLRLP